MQYQKKQYGPLEVIEVPNEARSGPYIILFHGYGADAFDLLPLSTTLDPTHQATWLFPQGHLEIHFSPSYMGHAWFPVDIEALRKANESGIDYELFKTSPPELHKARDLVMQMLKIKEIPISEVILGGFSQGSMLAIEVALTAEESPGGLIVLSGTLLDEKRWSTLALKRAQLPFFQSHGDHDPLLPLKDAVKLEKIFLDAGMPGKLHSFQGGHEIPNPIIWPLQQFLSSYITQ